MPLLPEALLSFQHIFLIATEYNHNGLNICQYIDGQYKRKYLPNEKFNIHSTPWTSVVSAFFDVAKRALSLQSSYPKMKELHKFESEFGKTTMILTITDVSVQPVVLSRVSVIKTTFPPNDQRQPWKNTLDRTYVADSVIAVAKATSVEVDSWDSNIMMEIILKGQEMYRSSRTNHMDISEVRKEKFSLDGKQFELTYISEVRFRDDLRPPNFSVWEIESELEKFFGENNSHDHCIISVYKAYVTIIKKNGIFYLFDPRGRGELGLNFRIDLHSGRYGVLIILKNIPDLSEVLIRNLGNVPIGSVSTFEDKENTFKIYSLTFTIKAQKIRVRDGEEKTTGKGNKPNILVRVLKSCGT